MISLKRCFILIIMMLMISALFATSILAQDNHEIPLDKLKTPTELQDIIDTFDRLKYNFAAFNDGEKAQEWLVEFQYQGKEEVQDVKVDKISIKTSTMQTSQVSLMTFWMNDGEIVKMVQNEQEIPAQMANSMKEKWLQAVFFPFYYFDKLNLEEIASEGEVTRSQKMIGELEEEEEKEKKEEKVVDIFEIKANNLAKHGLKSGTMKLADFGKLLMMVSFDYITLEEAEAEFKKGRFKIKEIELR